MNSKLSAYQAADTMGKSQLELVIKVYDGAISAFKAAREAYGREDSEGGYQGLEKAKKFITHLYTTLDMDNGGEIARQLGRLYAYVLNQTSIAQATKDLSQIDDNISVLKNLREGWTGLRSTPREEAGTEQSSSEPETSGTFSTSV